MADEVRRALAGSLDGWVDDDLAFVQSWGFDLAAVTAPVRIWQGELDLMVPAAHGPWLAAHISGARLSAVAGHGHISLVQTYRGTILDDLRRTAG